jgi:Flp pilus assembly protein CpaB
VHEVETVNAKLTLVIAVVAGLVAVFLVQRHVANVQGETITVYRAIQDHPAGEPLGDAIEEVSIPAGLFPNLLEEAPTTDLAEFVQTTPLRADVSKGDILLFTHFDSAIDPGVRAEIPAGMKAIAIAVDEASSVSFFVQPGDLVDVLATFTGDEQTSGPQQNSALFDVSTRPLVQATRVLAVGSQYRRSERQIVQPYSSVTLLVSMAEAAKLIFARDFMNATMTLVLRSATDTGIEQQLPRVGIDTLEFDEIGNTPPGTAPTASAR